MSVAFSHDRAGAGDVGADARVLARVHTLADGTALRLRLLLPSDGPGLRAAFERLSPQSRYLRFFTPVPHLTNSMLRRLTSTDGWNHVALVAEAIPTYDEPPEPVGVARFFRLKDRPDAAEVAVTVIDECQGRGLGRLLLGGLARLARNRGIRRFVASVLDENGPMKALIQRAGRIAAVQRDGAVVLYEIELPPPRGGAALPGAVLGVTPAAPPAAAPGLPLP